MVLKLPPRTPLLPVFLQRRSTDEYTAAPPGLAVRRACAQVIADGPKYSSSLGLPLGEYWSGRRGTATALRALDEAWGGGFYNVPEEAALDLEAADVALGGEQLVIDVQTHYISDRPGCREWVDFLAELGESVESGRFKGVNKLIKAQRQVGYSFAEYLRCVFLETETAVAVLSSAPGVEGVEKTRMLTNSEMIGTRELSERLGGLGRLINHCVVHPNVPSDMESMDRWIEGCRPAGWKVYTLYCTEAVRPMDGDYPSWMLDDEVTGFPFLQRALDAGVHIVCAHKGISGGAATGWDGPSSPRDIGPAAAAFPGIDFLVYHSGYEPRQGDQEEGLYSEETFHVGTNRLVKSLEDAGIGPGANVYAELGSTWFLTMAHPREAAHVMGKLLLALGEDNILWGTDSIFYGPAQPLIDAFRAFQIPEEYCQRYGYPRLTPVAKEKILGLNAARVYGLDPEEVRSSIRSDDLTWVKLALEEYAGKGMPSKV